jgi:hypothetical protein
MMMSMEIQDLMMRLSARIKSSWIRFKEASESSKALIMKKKSIREIIKNMQMRMRTQTIEVDKLDDLKEIVS